MEWWSPPPCCTLHGMIVGEHSSLQCFTWWDLHRDFTPYLDSWNPYRNLPWNIEAIHYGFVSSYDKTLRPEDFPIAYWWNKSWLDNKLPQGSLLDCSHIWYSCVPPVRIFIPWPMSKYLEEGSVAHPSPTPRDLIPMNYGIKARTHTHWEIA